MATEQKRRVGRPSSATIAGRETKAVQIRIPVDVWKALNVRAAVAGQRIQDQIRQELEKSVRNDRSK